MRISDWSSDVCSSDLQEEGTGLAELERRRDLPSKVQRGAAGEGRLGFTSREVRQAEGGAAREVERDVVRCDDAVTKDRKSVVEGKSVSVRVDLGGRRIIKKKK